MGEKMRGNILVVDDEKTTRMALCEALNQIGHHSQSAASAEEAMVIISGREFDAVILDLQMPGVGGVTLLAKANELAPNTGFIVLTAYGSTDSAILALRSGATDYLLKPCSLETIFKAVERALFRQQERKALTFLGQAMAALHSQPLPEPSQSSTNLIQLGPIIINCQQQTAAYQQHPLELTPTEYRLLLVFAQSPGRVLTYRELARQSHQSDLDEETARILLRTRLCRKLDQQGPSPLQLVRGRGYILLAQSV